MYDASVERLAFRSLGALAQNCQAPAPSHTSPSAAHEPLAGARSALGSTASGLDGTASALGDADTSVLHEPASDTSRRWPALGGTASALGGTASALGDADTSVLHEPAPDTSRRWPKRSHAVPQLLRRAPGTAAADAAHNARRRIQEAVLQRMHKYAGAAVAAIGHERCR